ncbi:hypothetical protein [Brevundimonas sp.]|uniref:hypothetical protein n=1 Tax=Brevundimonas sp. TaxID=1871086 RepID=UPI0035B228D6
MDWALILAIAAFGGVWTMSYGLTRQHKRIEALERQVVEVYSYVQEIDPNLEEERRLEEELFAGDSVFAGASLNELKRGKRARGERTLHDPIIRD